jgi:UDP:flavonoid glycosyltransferase YjiC (YdhE family)
MLEPLNMKGTRLSANNLTITGLRDNVRQAMTMTDGARRVAAGYSATGGASRGANLIEQRLLKQRSARTTR